MKKTGQTTAEWMDKQLGLRCATVIQSTGNNCPNVPKRKTQEGDLLCLDCFDTYVRKNELDEVYEKQMNCKHPMTSLTVLESGLEICDDCGVTDPYDKLLGAIFPEFVLEGYKKQK